jgi:nucleotide-binding universal stress UspA family protein
MSRNREVKVFSNILVAIDGSSASKNALEKGIDLSRKFTSGLHLLHVVRQMQVPLNPGLMEKYEEIERQRHDFLRSAGEQTLNQAKRVAQSKGIESVTTIVGAGDPATEIVNYADNNAIDLIVMGSRGLGQVESMLMGSVSRKVGNKTKADCLIVK